MGVVIEGGVSYAVCPWEADRTSSVELETRSDRMRLGGGYELRIDVGAHPSRRRYTAEYNKRSPAEALAIEAFYAGAGRSAFPFQDPDSGEWVQVRVDGKIVRKPHDESLRLRDVRVGLLEVFEP